MLQGKQGRMTSLQVQASPAIVRSIMVPARKTFHTQTLTKMFYLSIYRCAQYPKYSIGPKLSRINQPIAMKDYNIIGLSG